MLENSTSRPDLIVPKGTQIVVAIEDSTSVHPKGAVAEIIACPSDATHSYRVRFPDGSEASLKRSHFSILKQVKRGPLGELRQADEIADLKRHVIYRCVVGSTAYDLSREASDIDRRGIYQAPAELEWSLYCVPEQIESQDTQECYWELKKFLVLALKANPNILECLYTPLIEHSTEVSEALLEKRQCFLSKLVYQTYNGYVMSQFKNSNRTFERQAPSDGSMPCT